MSMASFEREILAGARVAFNNLRLKNKDIQEWSSAGIAPHDGEVVLFIKNTGVWVAIKKENDKREG